MILKMMFLFCECYSRAGRLSDVEDVIPDNRFQNSVESPDGKKISFYKRTAPWPLSGHGAVSVYVELDYGF